MCDPLQVPFCGTWPIGHFLFLLFPNSRINVYLRIKFTGETEIEKRFNLETKENKEKGCLGKFTLYLIFI